MSKRDEGTPFSRVVYKVVLAASFFVLGMMSVLIYLATNDSSESGGHITASVSDDKTPMPTIEADFICTYYITEGEDFMASMEHQSGPVSYPVTYTVDIVGGTADSNDVVLSSGSITVMPGSEYAYFYFPTIDDAIAEPDETVELYVTDTICNSCFVDIAYINTTVTILDNDEEQTVSIEELEFKKKIESIDYYDFNGKKLDENKLPKTLIIEVTTYEDGTISKRKILR
jgi:hypothetical protein